MSFGLTQNLKDGSSIRICKHKTKYVVNEYAVTVGEPGNSQVQLWLNKNDLIQLKKNIEELLEQQL